VLPPLLLPLELPELLDEVAEAARTQVPVSDDALP
jgi:hypothetical protein